MNKKSYSFDLDTFRNMLQMCPKLLGQKFIDPPFEEDILTFMRELGYPGNIKLLSDVKVDTLPQPWRTFGTIINKCLSGKVTGIDTLHLVFQIENKESRKNKYMFYPRFTKVIINHFMSQDQSISRRNKVDWHMANDDPILTTMRFIPQHEVVQRYGAILPDYLTNPAMKASEAYKTYHDLATGKVQPKPKYVRRSSRLKTEQEPKPSPGKRVKATAKVAKSRKKNQPTLGLEALSDIALTEAEQLKLVTKQSLIQTHTIGEIVTHWFTLIVLSALRRSDNENMPSRSSRIRRKLKDGGEGVPKELPKVSMVNTSLKKLNTILAGFGNVDFKKEPQPQPSLRARGIARERHGHKKVKERIKSVSGNMNEDKIKKDIEEIETINIELDHRVSKLIAEKEHLKQTYKQLYDLIKPTRVRLKEQCDALVNQVNQKSVEISDLNASLQEKVLVITTLKNELRKLKGKDLGDNVVSKNTVAPGMLKIDVETIASKLTVKSSLKNKNCVVKPKGTANVQHSKLNANSKLLCVKCNGCMLSDNHDLCVLDFINDVNARAKSKSVKKSSTRKIWKPTGKVFTKIGYTWRPTGRTFTIVGNVCPLTRITTTAEVPLRKPTALESDTPKPVVTLVYSRKPRKSKTNVPVSKPKIIKSISANKKEPSKS
ncbi:hypothetical protein Tco_0956206 [Tanacetum coccineum]|uniref:Uncharacterized protein n=1 Tax=Tanacetum coccineum TaxID=301880 RepID=A0ABQ5E9C0_9ASTR